ncbi:hypothetical protein CPHO_08420 [Corynebacterium phocae]|uniref:Uncharacterized protein n=1 Tax=Corynebacterium phocae TaxID=161895 RepID=A0A1L7D4B7_9CORY|nr:hypothetical protein [Corynebacterium phocae]APT92907.1 hypothetical protein CPHO_08420 [Corynebacterium phocae]KAA8723231.1 hypothetical protein F4V58_07915 [Corynebacterium phocae]
MTTATLERPTRQRTGAPKTAWIIRQNLPEFRGEAHLWATSDSKRFITSYTRLNTGTMCRPMYLMETMCFPANKDGEVVDWLETAGLRMSEPAHREVIEMTGYTPISKETPNAL